MADDDRWRGEDPYRPWDDERGRRDSRDRFGSSLGDRPSGPRYGRDATLGGSTGGYRQGGRRDWSEAPGDGRGEGAMDRAFGRGFGSGYRDEDDRGGGRSGGRDRSGRGYDRESDNADRGVRERAGDEVASWFGSEDAARRRRDDQAGGFRGRGPKGYRRSDERIRDDVSDRLSDDPYLDASEIEVTVSEAEVTLSGTVGTRTDKRRAEDLAEAASGVTHVQNNLRVRSVGASGRQEDSSGRSGSGSAGGGVTSATSAATRGTAATGSGTTLAGASSRSHEQTAAELTLSPDAPSMGGQLP